MEILSTYRFTERVDPVQRVDLGDAVKDAFRDPNRSIGLEVKSIDTTFLTDDLVSLLELTQVDQEGHEMHRNFKLRLNDGEIIGEDVGRGNRASNRGKISILFVKGIQSEAYVGGIHTHPSDISIPSIKDFTTLLLPSNDLRAATFQLIASRYNNTMIFRGRNTPQLPIEDVEKNAEFIAGMINSALKPSFESVAKLFLTLGKSLKIKELMIQRLASDFDFQFFQGERGSNILYRKTFDQLVP